MRKPSPRRARGLALSAAATLVLAAVSSPAAARPFSVAVLPDTQNYTTVPANIAHLKAQARWIVDHTPKENIVFTLHLGDIQQNGNPRFADGTPTPWLKGDEGEWVRADAALDILDDNRIPWSVVPGNHDYLRAADIKEPGYYLKWFGPDRFKDKPTFGGASPATPTSPAGMNTFHRFSAGGYTFLNLALQFGPNEHDLAWAQQVINAHPGLPTIVTTHALLDRKGYQPPRRNVWEQFLAHNPQIFMTVNGHISGVFRQSPANDAGQPCHQILVDYQNFTANGIGGGAGYMRLMTFDLEKGTVDVRSFSPVLPDAPLTDPGNQFTLKVDFPARFGPPPVAATARRTVTFRPGDADYAGLRDASVSAARPDASDPSAPVLRADVDDDADPSNGRQPSQSLLRFDSIVGDQPGQIPAGAIIESATLALRAAGDAAPTEFPVRLVRLLTPWTDAVTWSSLTDGISPDGREAILAPDDTEAPRARAVTFDVTASVAAWVRGQPNHGWAILPPSPTSLADSPDETPACRLASSESPDPDARPTLTVTYRTAP